MQDFWAASAQVDQTDRFRQFAATAAPRLAELRRTAGSAPRSRRGSALGNTNNNISGNNNSSGSTVAGSASGNGGLGGGMQRAEVRALSRARPIDAAWVAKLTDELAAGRALSLRAAERLVLLVFPLLARAPNVQECTVARNGKVTVVGDLHGQLADLLSVFRLNGVPSPQNQYIFNGDWVDRGAHSCECLLLLLAWKVLLPGSVFLNRGNHEAADINSRDGFETEVLLKYGPDLFALFSELFACAPLATVIRASDAAQEALRASQQVLPSVLVLHGGLPASAPRLSLADLNAVDRFHTIPPPNSLLCDLLWSDPGRRRGSRPNPRGAGVEFGPDVTAGFLARNNLCMLVRSHECVDNGWSLMHENRCVTVFSASNYCGVTGNQGAYALFEGNLRPTFVTYFAQHEVFAARSSTRYRLLEQDVVRKLMDRIAMNRLDLVEHYAAAARHNRATLPDWPCSDEVVTRAQWAAGLAEVLGLDVPFLLFQEQLGLPERGVLGDEKGAINFMTFLAPFQPSHQALKSLNLTSTSNARAAGRQGGSDCGSASGSFAAASVMTGVSLSDPAALEAARQEGSAERTALQHLSTLLFAHKYELQSVFRFFDHNGDDSVSLDEFAGGLLALVRLFRARARLEAQQQEQEDAAAAAAAASSEQEQKSRAAERNSAALTRAGVSLVPPTFSAVASMPDRPTRRSALSAAQKSVLGRAWTLRMMRRVARLVDLNGDGEIQYSEFFAHFDYSASGASTLLQDRSADPLAAKYRATSPSAPQITSVVTRDP